MNNVSIIIPTYNRSDMLDRLLESVINQTYKNFEVIVVDDNSNNIEAYKKVVDKYSKAINEFTYYRNAENKGAPYCRNLGIKKSKYELLAFVDDDDEWLPDKLKLQVKKIINNPKIGLVYTWTNAVDEKYNVLYEYKYSIKGNALYEILKKCFIPSPSVMVKKTVFDKTGLFDESFPSCQDWDMWTRIFAEGYHCDVVKKVVTLYHKHENPTIGTSKKAAIGYRLFYRKHMFKYIKVFLKKFEIKQIIIAIIKAKG